MKKQILFVDDEPNVLAGLRRSLRTQRAEWQMAFCDGARDALELIDQTHFDAVVTDMRMPGMDGGELLNRLAEKHPDTVRIVLSGHSDQETIMRSVGPAHQYLNKPCEVDVLKRVLARAFSLRELLGSEKIKSLISGMQSLPSMPALYMEMMQLLADPNASVRQVGDLIEQDPAMTAKTLQLVNSAFFGLGRHVSSPHDAASLLGLDILKSLVLSIGIFSQYDDIRFPVKGFSIEALWRHCSRVGGLARQMAEAEGVAKQMAQDCLLAGLLHDIGKLILAVNLPAEYQQMLDAVAAEPDQVDAIEQAAFGTSHGAVGAYLLGLWGLPESVVEAVAFHNHPGQQREVVFGVLSLVHVASGLVNQASQVKSLANAIDLEYLTAVDKEERLESWATLLDEIDP
ncbi:response regulator [endosymbiont of Ridgeia piscesae]|jgi:HD-like signal output (HDOD) protein|uniref:HD-like signal output (HDOD) domain, no enzymatic activity n=1 Tax=endosymbiont of Ridgeia piscesae TaxID=54398 RepID=A0A0T5ZA61_9GAMM|nr:response regulator [endosymbiont of Ridgeia piscesae]KRT55868.1 HD-like signal output (HDOD) domain, no enzymatic activity [endosymbiont of Ridgeia piscesae]KRT59744.1 HD-like signal output (HDOD) domain, no enzymatic activity [endosymbiont of Ridgeia piscesae]